MTIIWSLFVPGLLLLLFPADRLLSSAVRLRSFDCFQSLHNSARHRPWWWVPALWLDPVRALIGGLLLKQAFGLDSVYWSQTAVPAYTVLLGILSVAIWCQTYTRRDENVMLAPIGFVIGLIAAMTSWQVALGGMLIGFTGLFAFRQFPAFFLMGLGAVALIGFAFGEELTWLIPAVAAFGLPLGINLFSGRTMELPTRDSSGRSAEPPLPASR
jgi:hypothetical protein